jgi:hypothetical protein
MIEMCRKIGGSSLSNEDKARRLAMFFEVNKKTLSSIGPDLFLDVKNEVSDIMRKLGDD